MFSALRQLTIGSVVLILLCLGVLTGTVHAQDKKRIIILETMTLPLVQEGNRWFREGMSMAGHREGQNVEFLTLNADGNLDRARELLAKELETQQPDLVITIATLASRAGRELLVDSGVPQVFFFVADPVKEGFVSAVGQTSDSNITGRTHVVPATSKLQVVAQSLSQKVSTGKFRIGLLHSNYPSSRSDTENILLNAKDYPQFEFLDLQFDYNPGAEGKTKMTKEGLSILKAAKDKVDFIWLTNGPVENDPQFLAGLKEVGIPVVFANNQLAVEEGALIALLSNAQINGLAAATQADAILKGQPAGAIPVTRPDRFLVAVNVATAEKIETVIPSELLKLAEDNIYR